MSEWLTVSEAVAAALVALALLIVCSIWARRHALAASGPVLLCAFRTPTAKAWRLGLLRFGPEALEWFTFAGLTLRPSRSWRRSSVRMGVAQPTRDLIPGISDPVRVSAEADGAPFELAMARGSHTAMRSWMESAPPGYGVNIT